MHHLGIFDNFHLWCINRIQFTGSITFILVSHLSYNSSIMSRLVFPIFVPTERSRRYDNSPRTHNEIR